MGFPGFLSRSLHSVTSEALAFQTKSAHKVLQQFQRLSSLNNKTETSRNATHKTSSAPNILFIFTVEYFQLLGWRKVSIFSHLHLNKNDVFRLPKRDC